MPNVCQTLPEQTKLISQQQTKYTNLKKFRGEKY